jgi:uncharacterized repeat protein (TIGR01451 family)
MRCERCVASEMSGHMSSGWTRKNCMRMCYLVLAGLLMSGGVASVVDADEADGDDATKPVVTLRAELRMAQNHATQNNGSNAFQFVPATVIQEGQEIDYTVRIVNPDTVALPAAVVVQALPTHTHYVSGSAAGAGADIQFSVDGGQHFAKPAALRSPINPERVANAAEYTHIRWQLRYPLAPKAVVLARFRAVFE